MAEKFIPSEQIMISGNVAMEKNAISAPGKVNRIKANNKIFVKKSFMCSQY
jgi:hypothetical protein